MNLFNYRELAAAQELSKFVKKFWVLDNALNHSEFSNKSVLPNGCFNIAFISGNEIVIENKSGKTVLKEGIYLSCQLSMTIDVIIKPFTKIFLTQLYPWVPVMFSDFPFEKTADCYVPLQEINSGMSRSLAGIELYNEAFIVQFFQNHFLKYLEKNRDSDLILEASLLMKEGKGNISVAELSGKLGFSTRFVEKKFKQHLGLSPKEFSTILKIRNSVDEMTRMKQFQSMVQLALENGFYDQAHFIKTFSGLANTSPGKFDAEKFLLPFDGKGF